MSAFDQGLVASISQHDCALLIEALELLLRNRSSAHRIATDIAASRDERQPDVCEFGLQVMFLRICPARGK